MIRKRAEPDLRRRKLRQVNLRRRGPPAALAAVLVNGSAQNPAANPPAAGPADQADEVGQVATLQGSATVTRGDPRPLFPCRSATAFLRTTRSRPARVRRSASRSTRQPSAFPRTRASSSNEFIYQEGGGANAAAFKLVVGTAAFVASLVAKTGDMKISTPSATLGIRGATGVVDVPEGGGAGEPRIKLYPDADGHVGQIEVFNRQGGRLGTLREAPALSSSGRARAEACAPRRSRIRAGSSARPRSTPAAVRAPTMSAAGCPTSACGRAGHRPDRAIRGSRAACDESSIAIRTPVRRGRRRLRAKGNPNGRQKR